MPYMTYKLSVIENTLFRARTLQKHIYQTKWLPLFKEAALVKEWWGYANVGGTGKPEKVVFHCDNGLGWQYADHSKTTNVQTLPISEVCLRINDPDPEIMRAAKDRLSGSLPEILPNQPLVDRYFKQEHQSSRTYGFSQKATEILVKYASQKSYEDTSQKRYREPNFVVKLTLNGRTYVISPPQNKIVFYPEDVIPEYTDDDVLADETKNPQIHGGYYCRK